MGKTTNRIYLNAILAELRELKITCNEQGYIYAAPSRRYAGKVSCVRYSKAGWKGSYGKGGKGKGEILNIF